jgi:hypothetical protein
MLASKVYLLATSTIYFFCRNRESRALSSTRNVVSHRGYHDISTFTFSFQSRNSAECSTKSPVEAENWGALGSIIIHGDSLSREQSAVSKRPPHCPIRCRFRQHSLRDRSFESSLVRVNDLSIVRSALVFRGNGLWNQVNRQLYYQRQRYVQDCIHR